jgi:hypothetical protein
MKAFRNAALGVTIAVMTAGAAAAHPIDTCKAAAKGLAQIATPKTVEATPSGGCLFRDLTIVMSPRMQFHVDDIETGPLAGAVLTPDKLSELHAVARHIRFQAQTQQPLINFILSAQTRPFSMAIDYRFDAANGRLDLQRFLVTSPELGDFRLSATLQGLHAADLTRPPTQLPPEAGLTSIDLEMDNKGLFEGLALAPMATLLLHDQTDPAAAFAEMNAKSTAATTRLLTQAGASRATIQAIAAFNATFPKPRGRFHMHADFPAPLTRSDVAALLGKGDDQAAALKKWSALTATYTPPPPEPQLAP